VTAEDMDVVRRFVAAARHTIDKDLSLQEIFEWVQAELALEYTGHDPQLRDRNKARRAAKREKDLAEATAKVPIADLNDGELQHRYAVLCRVVLAVCGVSIKGDAWGVSIPDSHPCYDMVVEAGAIESLVEQRREERREEKREERRKQWIGGRYAVTSDKTGMVGCFVLERDASAYARGRNRESRTQVFVVLNLCALGHAALRALRLPSPIRPVE
jgi:hypothetical protein